MSPFKGQGANQALEDAVDLAKSLADLLRSKQDASKDDVATLLRNYEDRMMKRASPKVLGSRSNVEVSLCSANWCRSVTNCFHSSYILRMRWIRRSYTTTQGCLKRDERRCRVLSRS